MPLQATSGAASYDAFGGGVAAVPQYIEDIFSTTLYTGNSSTQTITNGIDLAGKGGLVWFKQRNAANNHALFDTSRGTNKLLYSNTTSAQVDSVVSYSDNTLTAFNTNGFTLGNDPNLQVVNTSPNTYASWTFRKQPKFFDVVTYTGDGASPRTIAHSLGSTPGCIIIKRLDASGDWKVHHRSIASITQWLRLDSTLGLSTNSQAFTSFPDANSFYVGNNNDVNASGGTYVAYLFAHNAGGFGLTGTDNVISCGSFTTDGSGNATVNLGYEPQWVLIKNTSAAENWYQLDTMRGWVNNSSGGDKYLSPNLSSAEGSTYFGNPTATGFYMEAPAASNTYIYIAIRRGPMKVPTSGTSVFTSVTKTGATSVGQTNTTNFPVDLSIDEGRATNYGATFFDRLRGSGPYLNSSSTAAEANQSPTYYIGFDSNTSVFNKNYGALGATYVNWLFQRAPSFMDVVCYTGTGSATTVTHNLGVVPELIITKCRGDAFGWAVYSSAVGNTAALFLETTAIPDTNSAYWNNTTPTSTVFSVGSANRTNRTSLGMVAYLFATCAGVSKVGSYTGNGTSQVINCGFTSGARFVLIKSTTEARSWCVFDTARGIASGNDPVLYLQATSAEVTSIDWLAPNSSGFEIVTSQGNINGSGQTYIFLAIA